MMKKMILLSLISLTLTLHADFIMTKGQALKKAEETIIQPNSKPTTDSTTESTVEKTETPTPTSTKNNNRPKITYYDNSNPVKILAIGDSFTDGADYLKPLQSLISSTNHKVSFVGTKSNAGINHEGRAGWTAEGYMNLNTKWYPNSPFLNKNNIDFKYYFNSKLKLHPNVIIIQLGVNDIIGVTKGIGKGYYNYDRINTIINDVKLILTGLRNALPVDSKILMMMPTPASTKYTPTGFDKNKYYDVWEKYRTMYLAEFANKESENIYLVRTDLPLNRENDFADFVHPNEQGYLKIAETLMKEISSLYKKK